MEDDYKIIKKTSNMFIIEYMDNVWGWYMEIRPQTITKYKNFIPDNDKIEDDIDKIDEVFYFDGNKTFENFVENIKNWCINPSYKYILFKDDSIYTYKNNGLITSNNKGIRYLDPDYSYGKFIFYTDSVF